MTYPPLMRRALVLAVLLFAACGGGGEQVASTTTVTAAPASPNLRLLAAQHGLSQAVTTGNQDSVVLNFFAGTDAGFSGFLDELGFNALAITQRMGATRALDGTLTEASDVAEMTWTYHPDDGLTVVVAVTDP